MIIEFLKCRFKNIISVGNYWQEIDYTVAKNTMITGKNGSGKSAIILDTITYALFGRANREIKVAQLINSITGKELVVELTFRIGTDIYKIIRGQKPAIFEVYKNDELINEEASTRDYQKVLEQQILHMNLKTFKQIVIIGSATYKPLMQLDAKERREVTEDILDITIFSGMSKKASERFKELNNEIKTITTEVAFRKEQEKTQKELIVSMEEEKKTREVEASERIAEAEERIVEIDDEIKVNEESIVEREEKMSSFEIPTASTVFREKIRTLQENRSKLNKQIGKFESVIETQEEQIEFFSADSCPTCSQPISDDHRHTMHESAQASIDATKEKMDASNVLIEQFDEKIEQQQTELESITRIEKQVTEIEYEIKGIRRNIAGLQNERKSQEKIIKQWSGKIDSSALKEAKKSYKENLKLMVDLSESKAEKQELLAFYQMAVKMLKDDGVKAQLIDETLPEINRLINKYLKKFDMFVQFELTNTFEEIIKARHRDTFSYNSFSEGQKRRLDHAILFAFREIAMMKGSISCNIVAFDEILEKNLDEDGKEVLQELIAGIDQNVHVFVISPIAFTPEFFDRVLTITYPNEFTKIEETK